jgi:uncharacterized membrane protein YccF (DUF307 family)
VPTPNPFEQVTQPLQPDVLSGASVPGDLVASPGGLPVAQPSGQVAGSGYPPPPVATYNTAAVQVNNVVAAPQVHLSLQQHKTPFILRAIWFVCFGWWLSGLAIIFSALAFYFILTIPLGIWLLHRVPKIQTLRDRTREFQTHVVGNNVVIREGTISQRPFLQRAVWFVFVGWWLTTIWLVLAWLLSITIVLLPVSIMMIDRAPGLLTLQKY